MGTGELHELVTELDPGDRGKGPRREARSAFCRPPTDGAARRTPPAGAGQRWAFGPATPGQSEGRTPAARMAWDPAG
jgi:hypothetical protein